MRGMLLLLCLSLMSSLANAGDLDGLWVGYYEIENSQATDSQGTERVECAVVLEQTNSEFTGTMIERPMFVEDVADTAAQIAGRIEGEKVEFAKRYIQQAGNGDMPIYGLILSGSGDTLAGRWHLPGLEGKAFFRRITHNSIRRIPVPPLPDTTDFNGLWVGEYSMSDGGMDTVEYAAIFQQHDGKIYGMTVEWHSGRPASRADPGVPAKIGGYINGRKTDFGKFYQHQDDDRFITYELEMRPHGHTLDGHWRLVNSRGSTTLRRVPGSIMDKLPLPE